MAASMAVFVYKVTNKHNGKFYIGITRRAPRRRLSEHFCHAARLYNNGAFYRAIRKYGKEAFDIEVVETVSSIDEAKIREVELISELRPHYNSTVGGDCSPGISDDGRRRLSEFHRGNRWALGYKHSEDTKERLRDLGHANIDTFKKYSHLGPEKLARKVLCVDTGEVFKSASDAARYFDISRSMIIELCNKNPRRKTAGGRRFEYVEEK